MKYNQLAVALIVYSGSGKMVSVNADQYGYTGSEYTYFGENISTGACGSGNHYSYLKWVEPHTDVPPTMSITACAQFCQSQKSLQGQVGFDVSLPEKNKCGPNDVTGQKDDCQCNCRYVGGSGPESFTSTDGLTWVQTASTCGQFTQAASNWDYGDAWGYVSYSHNNFGVPDPTDSPTNAPSTSPSTNPSKSPSKSPSESPSKTLTGSPTNAPTKSPSKSPSSTGSPSQGPTELTDTLYYPDWSKSNGGCKTGGGQPTYMTSDPSTWMFVTRDGCCVRYFPWMINECKGTSTGSSSDLWYPDWAGADDTCKNDGNEPGYMASDPGSWMHLSQQDCCEANFGWELNECIGSSNGAGTGKWYMIWDAPFKCQLDCAVGTGPSCGGRANSWDQLFDTRSACCSDKASWSPTNCLVD